MTVDINIARGSLNGPDFGPYSGHQQELYRESSRSLNGPDFGPYSGRELVWSCELNDRLNGPDFGPYSGLLDDQQIPAQISLNGPDFGPYSGRRSHHPPPRSTVSTGLTSAHIPDNANVLDYLLANRLNGPDFGPYSGRTYPEVLTIAAVSQRA